MLIPRKSLVVVAAALLLAGPAPGAQSGRGGPVYDRVNKPPRPVTLDLRTGTLIRGPRPRRKAVTTCTSLDNNDFSGFVGNDTGNSACEWWDEALKTGGTRAQRIGGKSGLMTGFSFAYCSAALDPASFGPGGSAVISFREGYSRGTAANSAGPSGTLVGSFAMSGLPANTAFSSFFGGFNCYLITVTLGNTPLCFGGDGMGGPEPSVAWAWRFADLGTDGVLAATFPFLSCVASCTEGPGSKPFVNDERDGTGMTDGIDQYCPPGSILSAFTFGTTTHGGWFTSISMAVREAAISSQPNAVLASAANARGVGPAERAAERRRAVAPQYQLDCSQASANAIALFRVGFAAASPLPSRYGTIYVPLQGFLGFNVNLGLHGRGVVNVAGGVIPKDLTLGCAPVSLQGFCGDSPLGFVSDGLDGILNVAALK